MVDESSDGIIVYFAIFPLLGRQIMIEIYNYLCDIRCTSTIHMIQSINQIK